MPDKNNSVYNSLKQTWPWGSEGRAGQGGLVRRSKQNKDSGSGVQTQDDDDDISWRRRSNGGRVSWHSSERAAPNSLASRWEALYMQLSPEESSS